MSPRGPARTGNARVAVATRAPELPVYSPIAPAGRRPQPSLGRLQSRVQGTSYPRVQRPGTPPRGPSPREPSTRRRASAEVGAEVGRVESGGTAELDQPVAAHVESAPGPHGPGSRGRARRPCGRPRGSASGSRGRSAPRPRPGSGCRRVSRPGPACVQTDWLSGDLGQRPVGRLLAVDAPQGDRGEAAIDPDGEEVVLLRQGVVQPGVQVREAGDLGGRGTRRPGSNGVTTAKGVERPGPTSATTPSPRT